MIHKFDLSTKECCLILAALDEYSKNTGHTEEDRKFCSEMRHDIGEVVTEDITRREEDEDERRRETISLLFRQKARTDSGNS